MNYLKTVVSAFGLMLFFVGTAHADPFTQEQGQGRVIVSGIFTQSPKGFDANGKTVPIQEYDQNQVYIMGEYGVTKNFTVLLTPSVGNISLKGGDDSSGLGYTDVGGRYRLAKSDHWIISVQGLVKIPGTARNYPVPQFNDKSVQYDLRVSGGYMAGPAFITLDTAYRLRAGDPPNEFHIDATAGTHITPRLMLLASAYTTISDGGGRGVFNQSYHYTDVYASVVYDVTKRFSLQAGYTGTVTGKNSLRQRGPVVGIWYKF
ncbi:transporter [Novosphingobium sp.]|uniref:transporter n=1 Tax=Novosphingobium sp. TaxID=1874826 RepID=UPI0031DF4F2F